MRKFFVLLLFTTTVSIVRAQNTGSVQGIVTTSDGKAAPLVTIQVKGSKLAALTDDEGKFNLQDINAGNYTITASLVGHSVTEESITVAANRVTQINLQLKTSEQELKEVVVNSNTKSYISEKPSTSLRLNAALIEVPQNITIATKQTLNDMGLLSKTEIFRLSSGITKSYGSSMDMTVQIRGTDATYNTYRNGIGGPIWWNAQEDAAMVERLEFVKGPAGFMLANAEPGGLINTVTKQPTHQQIAEIGFGLGSWNMMRTTIDLGGEFKKEGKLTYRLNTGYQRNNEFYEFGAFNRLFVAPVLKYDFSDNTSVTFENNYVIARAQENVHSSISVNGDLWAIPTDMAINDPNNPKWKAADLYNRIYLRHKFSENWIFNAQAAYMTTYWGGQTLYIEGLSENKDTINRYVGTSDWKGDLSNIQLFLDGKFNTGKNAEHKVLFGIDYGSGTEGNTSEDTWGTRTVPLSIASPTYYLPKEELAPGDDAYVYTWQTTNRWEALYVQDHLKLFNKLIVTLAGRFTHLVSGQDYNTPEDPEYEVAENKFTPRLGLTYMFTDNISAYLLHDESFLPQRGLIYNGGRLPALTGRNNEIGVKALFFKKQLSIAASAYDIIKNDVGNSDPVHPGYYVKTGQIRSKGIEFDIAGKISSNFYVNANYSYTNPKITEDEDKTLIGLQNNGTAKNLCNIWLKYQVNDGVLKGFGIGGGMQYTDKRSGIWPGWNSSEGNKYLPAYTIFDAGLSYATGRFSIGLNAYNLANKKYANSGSWQPDINEWMFDIEKPFNFRLQTTIRL
ncbi:MAG TPA: TonB-dependent receptor [Parafilimonas sp.]|nr:TonB-dependent receptor [Parafilimonas sp.]